MQSIGADPISALAALLSADAPLTRELPRTATSCGCTARAATARSRPFSTSWPSRNRSTLTEIAIRLGRTPGSTKDYLSWLEDVDLVSARQKRYTITDPLLRLWVRLHCRPEPPSDDRGRAGSAPVRAGAAAAELSPRWWACAPTAATASAWGIIEID